MVGRALEEGACVLGGDLRDLAHDAELQGRVEVVAQQGGAQARVEHRWVLWTTRTNFEAFAGVHGGLAVYGERFGAITAGLALGGSVGVSYNLSAFFNLGLIARVEALRFLPFDTGDGVLRSDGGIATVSGTLHLALGYHYR